MHAMSESRDTRNEGETMGTLQNTIVVGNLFTFGGFEVAFSMCRIETKVICRGRIAGLGSDAAAHQSKLQAVRCDRDLSGVPRRIYNS